MNWAPYYSENLPGGGYFTEITRRAFARSGYQLRVEFVPWKRAIADAKSGSWDGVMGAYHSTPREQWFSYTNAVDIDESVFVALKTRGITNATLKHLQDYRIGHILGGKYSREFDNARYLRKYAALDDALNLKKLIAGRIDVFVSSRPVVLYQIHNSHPHLKQNIEFLLPPLNRQGLYNIISKQIDNHQVLVDAFNSGLQSIRQDGTLQNILDSRNPTYFQPQNSQ